MEAVLHDIEWKIIEHGWAVVAVGEGDSEPAFAYTVGLHDRGHPELYISALPPRVAQPILNDAVRRHLDTALPVGEPLHDLLSGGCAMVAIEMKDVRPLHVAHALQDGQIRALQLVYPDAAHRFPWDDGCALTQQRLYGSAPLT